MISDKNDERTATQQKINSSNGRLAHKIPVIESSIDRLRITDSQCFSQTNLVLRFLSLNTFLLNFAS